MERAKQMKHAAFNCYIDESGDEGFKFGSGSSSWFFVGAILVRQEDDAQVRGVIDDISKRMWTDQGQKPPAVLHWRKLSHNKKRFVIDQIKQLPFHQITVGFWKPYLDSAPFICRSDNLFRYTCRFLLERISWYVWENKGLATCH